AEQDADQEPAERVVEEEGADGGAERAGEDHAFERDVEYAAPLRQHAADGGEHQRHRQPEAGRQEVGEQAQVEQDVDHGAAPPAPGLSSAAPSPPGLSSAASTAALRARNWPTAPAR